MLLSWRYKNWTLRPLNLSHLKWTNSVLFPSVIHHSDWDRLDSLTQIVLGAAVGETVAGRKLGNRALLWGGIGGTIPDLDIIANGFLTPLQALVTHRGFSHSILFAIMGAFVFGWLIHAMYKSPYHRHIAFVSWFALPAGVLLFFSLNLIYYAAPCCKHSLNQHHRFYW